MAIPQVPGYELVRRLGRGGMGEVWLGRRPVVGGVAKSVAIKLVRLDQQDARSMQSFVDEARVSTLLGHSNIAQVFDVGTTESFGYLVSEAIDGVDLARLLPALGQRGEGPSLQVTAYVIGQILRGLAYAHTLVLEGRPLQIVHRDISPQNVLVSVSGEVKVIDFGIARWSLRDTTGVGVKGKLHYMAPEQFGGGALDGRTDLYAVGAMLHEMLAGQRLRTGTSVAALYGELAQPVVPELPHAVDPVLDQLRRGLLQPDPEQRIPTAADAIALLSTSPCYRDASAELAALCRSVTGVEGPRAGLRDPVAVTPEDTPEGLTGSATWGGETTAAGVATQDASATLDPLRAPAEASVTLDAEVGTTPAPKPISADPRPATAPDLARTPSAPRPIARRIAIAAVVLAVGTAAVGGVARLLAGPPEEPISKEGPPITAPRHRDMRWRSGFCLMRRADSDVVVGFATVDEARRLVWLNAATGDVVDDQPADDLVSFRCLTRTELELTTTDGEARRIDADGEPIGASDSASGPCAPAPRVVHSPVECPDALRQAVGKPYEWDKATNVGFTAARADDGGWVLIEKAGDSRLAVARIEGGENTQPSFAAGNVPAKWRIDMESEIGPATAGVVWVRGEVLGASAITASSDAVAVYTASQRAREAAITFLDLDDASRLGRITLDRLVYLVVGFDATDSTVVLALAGPAGLLAFDPHRAEVLWRVEGVDMPWE